VLRARRAGEGDEEQAEKRSHRETLAKKKEPGSRRARFSERRAYFFASSLFALPLPLALAFFSPLAFFLSPLAGFAWSFFASAADGALGVVSDFGAWANAVNANAEAISIATSFLSIRILLLCKRTIR